MSELTDFGSEAGGAVGTHYETLGVPFTASLDEIRHAYRVRAQLYHPDRHEGSSPDVRRLAEGEFRHLTEAYEVLQDPEARTLYNKELVGEPAAPAPPPPPPSHTAATPGPSPYPPMPNGTQSCQSCGQGPTYRFGFYEIRGRGIWLAYRSFKGLLCRDCGLAVGRQFQCATLNLGWWSPLSAVATPFVALSNGLELRRATRLDEPRPIMGTAFTQSAPPGDTVVDRGLWGMFAGLVVIVLLTVLAIATTPSQSKKVTPVYPAGPTTTVSYVPRTSVRSSSPAPTNRSPLATTTQPRPSWTTGACVDVISSDLAMTVSCAGPHDGRVIATVQSPTACPPETTSSVTHAYEERTYCIERE